MRKRSVRAKALVVAGGFLVTLSAAPALANHLYNPPPHLEGVTPVTPDLGEKRWLTILCRFAGDPSTPHDAEWYRRVMGSTNGGMADYWSEVSFGRMTIEGSAVHGWYDLPQPRRDYFTADGLFVDEDRMIADCGAAAAADVHLPDFDGITFWVNGSLANVNNRRKDHGGQRAIGLDGETKLYHTVFLSSDDERPHGVLAHEMGHSLGSGHSGSEHRDQYGSNWDLMSGISRGCTYAHYPEWCVPVHPVASWKYMHGWLTGDDVVDVGTGETKTVTIDPLEGSRSEDGHLMARVYIRHSPLTHLTIEARRQRGFDAPLPDAPTTTGIPGEGVLVHRVDPFDFSVFLLDDSPGDTYLRDDEALRSVGETFVDPESGIEISVQSETPGGGYVVRISSPDLDDVPNDDLSFATQLRHGDVIDQQTHLASAAQDDPISPCNQGKRAGHTVWFRYRAPADGAGTFSTHGSDDWTLVDAYTREGDGLVNQGCAVVNPVAGSGNGPLEVRMHGGRDYYFLVAPYNRWWEGQRLHVEFSFLPGLPPEPAPKNVHLRTVSMRLRGHIVMTGRVRVNDGFDECAREVSVTIQRKRRGWIGVATTTTRSDGTYRVEVGDDQGIFRAKVPQIDPLEDDRCAVATSVARRHRH